METVKEIFQLDHVHNGATTFYRLSLTGSVQEFPTYELAMAYIRDALCDEDN